MEAAKICTTPMEIEEKEKYKLNLFSKENEINIIIENLEQIDVANYQGSFTLEFFQSLNKFFRMFSEPSEIIELICTMKNENLMNVIFEENKAIIILNVIINLKTEKVILELKKGEINQLETIKNLCQQIELLKKEIYSLKNKKEIYIIKTKINFGYVLGVDCENNIPKEGNRVLLFLLYKIIITKCQLIIKNFKKIILKHLKV